MNKNIQPTHQCLSKALQKQHLVRGILGPLSCGILLLALTACATNNFERKLVAEAETLPVTDSIPAPEISSQTDLQPLETGEYAAPQPQTDTDSDSQFTLLASPAALNSMNSDWPRAHHHLAPLEEASPSSWQVIAGLETEVEPTPFIATPWEEEHTFEADLPAPDLISDNTAWPEVDDESLISETQSLDLLLPEIYISPLLKDHLNVSQTIPLLSGLTPPASVVVSSEEPEAIILDEPQDLWYRLRNGFQLSGHNHLRIQPHINWYVKNQAYLDRVVERARPFLYEIVQEVARMDIPMEIALLPVVESAFQPFAYSSGRAAGIWQFIPGTGKRYGLKQNWWYDGRRDVPEATRAALTYLSELRKRFDGDWLLALAAYNSGEGRVMRAQKKNRAKGLGEDFWSLDLPNETRDYVPKLLAISTIVEQTEKYGIDLASIPDEPYLTHIDIGSQIDLALAAKLADLPIEALYKLNPAFNRWATDPKGPHILSLPIGKAEGFRNALAKVDNHIQWQRHRIRQGETLGEIAEKYQTSVTLLQQINNIRDKWIRAGNNIIIPVSTKELKHYLSEDQRRLTKQHAPRNGKKVQHTVRKGDTLWDLSRQYKVSVSKLASWNSMAPRDALMPGKPLVIWTTKVSQTPVKFAVPPSSQTRQRLQYKVRKGDSLARIAQKFRVTVNNLRNWNSLPKGKYLQPGQRLTLFVDVTRQS